MRVSYNGGVPQFIEKCMMKQTFVQWMKHVPRSYGNLHIVSYSHSYRRKFRSQTSTIWTDEKQSRAEAEGRGRLEERRSEEKRKSKRTEDTDARKGRKVAKQCVFPMICGSRGSKSRLAKAAGAEPAGHRSDEKLHAVVARSYISKSKCTKPPQVRTTFGSYDVEKVHAVVARSTFWSQNAQNTSVSDDFWKLRCRKSARLLWREAHFEVKMYKTPQCRTTFGKLRCRKSARRCGAKHILKWKCTKHTILGALLEVEMSKKCTPLWREAHFEVKSVKNWRSRTTFGGSDVEKVSKKVHAVVARSTFRSQKCKKLRVLRLFWREDVEKVDTD